MSRCSEIKHYLLSKGFPAGPSLLNQQTNSAPGGSTWRGGQGRLWDGSELSTAWPGGWWGSSCHSQSWLGQEDLGRQHPGLQVGGTGLECTCCGMGRSGAAPSLVWLTNKCPPPAPPDLCCCCSTCWTFCNLPQL